MYNKIEQCLGPPSPIPECFSQEWVMFISSGYVVLLGLPSAHLGSSHVRGPLSGCHLLLRLIPSFAVLPCSYCCLLKKVSERDISCLCIFEDFYFHTYLVVWLGKII